MNKFPSSEKLGLCNRGSSRKDLLKHCEVYLYSVTSSKFSGNSFSERKEITLFRTHVALDEDFFPQVHKYTHMFEFMSNMKVSLNFLIDLT